MEQEIAPIVIFASNRGITKVRGSNMISPHGMPRDLLDRLTIIKTKAYSCEEIQEIVKIRASIEGLKISDEAIDSFGKIGGDSSLRYACQLITPCNILADINGNDEITKEEIDEVADLFLDAKRSAKILREREELYL